MYYNLPHVKISRNKNPNSQLTKERKKQYTRELDHTYISLGVHGLYIAEVVPKVCQGLKFKEHGFITATSLK